MALRTPLVVLLVSACVKVDIPVHSCTDASRNQDEADVDCGGRCAPCADGRTCRRANDCVSGHCANELCTRNDDVRPPQLSALSVEPADALVGDTVVTSFSVDEPLKQVLVMLSDGSSLAPDLTAPAGRLRFTRKLDGSEREGTLGVRVSLTDAAGNLAVSEHADAVTVWHRKAGNPYTVVAYYYGEWSTPGQPYNYFPWSWLADYPERLPLASRAVSQQVRWDFERDDWGLSYSQLEARRVNGELVVTSTGDDPRITSPSALNVPGASFPSLSVRVRRQAGNGWEGRVYFVTTEDPVWDAAKSVAVPEPGWTQGSTELSFPLSQNTAWRAGRVRQFRVDLGASPGDTFAIDSLTLKPAPGEAPREETLGLPSDADWAVAWEMREAYRHGVDVFAVNYYWNGKANFADANLQLIKQSPAARPLRLCLSWANHDAAPTVHNIAEWHALLDEWNSRVFDSPRYWRIDGKPVVMVLSPDALMEVAKLVTGLSNPRDAIKALLADAQTYMKGRPAAENNAPQGIYWVSEHGIAYPFWTGRFNGWVGANEYAGFEASTVYREHRTFVDQVPSATGGSAVPWPSSNDDDVNTYALLGQVYQREWDWVVNASGTGIPYWVPITAGWNRRPWREFGDGAFHAQWNCSPTLIEFTEHLKAAKLVIDAAPRTTSRTVVVYAWNEYGEGAYLAPSFGYGTGMLEAVREVFGK